MSRTAVLLVLLAAACTKQEPAPANAPPPPPKTTEPAAATAVDPAAAAAAASTKRRIDIKVTMQGYEPSTIPLKTKEPVTLVFTRTEPTNCGSEVQIASLKWKQALPMNTPVTVDVTPEKAGEIVFACGMDMMHGILQVAD